MKKAIKFFIALSVIFAVFTGVQYFSVSKRSSPVLMKMEKATVKIDKNTPKPPPPTRADMERMAKERLDAEIALRKEKREDLKLWIGFLTTIFSSITSIVLAILNRKKE